jgi:hypothetical protein
MTDLFATSQSHPTRSLKPIWTHMTKPSDPPILFPDVDMAKTFRQLRFVRALFQIDDPELERALAVIMDRLAKASTLPDTPFPVSEHPRPKSPRE